MKTDRFASRSLRIAGILLTGLFLAAGLSAAGKSIRIGRVQIGIGLDSSSKQLADALAPQVGAVQKKLDENRRALRTVQGTDGGPAYLREDVAGLIVRTGEDLDKAIEKVQPSKLAPLQAWAAQEVGRIQGELAAVPVQKAEALSPGLFTPRPVAVVASLGGLPLLELSGTKAAPPKKPAPKKAIPKPAAPKPVVPPPAVPKPETITAGTSNRLLDELGKVVEKIFVLASQDDLAVKLWVGSTPAPRVVFSFWPQGTLKGSAPAPMIIRTDGKRDGVIRGLYSYRAAWSKGRVTDLIQYPDPAGAPAAQLSERLDLVNGTGFFCCRFGEHYCQQVANEKECRP